MENYNTTIIQTYKNTNNFEKKYFTIKREKNVKNCAIQYRTNIVQLYNQILYNRKKSNRKECNSSLA